MIHKDQDTIVSLYDKKSHQCNGPDPSMSTSTLVAEFPPRLVFDCDLGGSTSTEDAAKSLSRLILVIEMSSKVHS